MRVVPDTAATVALGELAVEQPASIAAVTMPKQIHRVRFESTSISLPLPGTGNSRRAARTMTRGEAYPCFACGHSKHVV
jgi:hypothetical protein